jgi:hypothetical protein
MSHRFIALFVALIALAVFSAAPPATQASARSTSPTGAIIRYPNPDRALHLQAYREYWCRTVTAVDVNIYATSTSTTPIGRAYRGQTFATTGIANNRYHWYNPYNDTWGGWITADPQWTDFAGYYCMG